VAQSRWGITRELGRNREIGEMCTFVHPGMKRQQSRSQLLAAGVAVKAIIPKEAGLEETSTGATKSMGGIGMTGIVIPREMFVGIPNLAIPRRWETGIQRMTLKRRKASKCSESRSYHVMSHQYRAEYRHGPVERQHQRPRRACLIFRARTLYLHRNRNQNQRWN
jgi:hypothetical protein